MKITTLLPFILLIGCAPVPQATPIELCEKTVRDYGVARDNGPPEIYANLFTLDGEFHLGPNITKGRSALIERHIESNKNSVWRHNMIDTHISFLKEGIVGTTSFHIFTGPRADKPSAHTREILGDYIDEFVIENGMCKIKSRKVQIVFDTSN